IRHIFAEREFEVVNLVASAINSNVILDLSYDVVDYDPDLVLVYMGHNEFYGPDGVGASLVQKFFPSTIQWVYDLRNLRIVSLLLTLLPHSHHGERQTDATNLIKHVTER